MADKIKLRAKEHFVLTDTFTLSQKITICRESKNLYSKAIFAYNQASEISPDAGAPRIGIGDCGRMIEKIDNQLNEFQAIHLHSIYKLAKVRGEFAAKEKKDFTEALEAYEEALKCFENEYVQKRVYNPVDELEYLKKRVEIMRYQVTLEKNKVVNKPKD